MKSRNRRSGFDRKAPRPVIGIEPLEHRVLLTGILIDEGQGQIAFVEDTAGVSNHVILSTGPGIGNALIKDTNDTLFIEPGIASQGWTLSSDGHTASGPETQATNYFIDTNDGTDVVAVQANDRPVKIEPELAYDTVLVGADGPPTGAQLNTASINFDCEFAGAGSLIVNDTGDPASRNVELTGSSVTGLTPGAVTFDLSLTDLTLITGSGGTIETVNQTDDASNFGGTQFLLDANADDAVNIEQLGTKSQIVTEELHAGGVDTINIGNNGSTAEINGSIVVDGFSGTANLTIDNSAGTLPLSIGISDSLTGVGDGTIDGFSLGTVDFILAKTPYITLYGGGGGNELTYDIVDGNLPATSVFLLGGGGDDTYNIIGTPANGSVDVEGGGGHDSMNLGGNGVSPMLLQGSISLSNQSGTDSILLDASGEPLMALRVSSVMMPTVGVNDTTVIGLIPATLSFADDTSVTVIGTSDFETFNVTPSTTASFTIDGGPFAPAATASDVLNVNTAGVNSPVLHLQADASGDQGSYTFANRQPITFSRFGDVTPALATISGTVSSRQTALPVSGAPLFLDENSNGSFDAGEPSVLSDGSGDFQFTSLAAGSYHVLLGTFPLVAIASPPTTTVAAGQVAAGINFAVVPAPTPGGPDLSGQVITPTALGGGSNGKIKLKVSNAGPGAVNASAQIALFASLDATLDPADTSLGSLPATPLKLKRGASKTLSFTANVPGSITDGNYFVLASIDSTNSVAESNEANNVAASRSQVTIAKPFIDLTGAFAGRLPTSIPAGKSAAASVLVGNVGNITATGSISISLFASADRSHGPADIPITTLTGQKIAIKPNRSHAIVVHFQAPAMLAGGNYFLIAVVNSDQTIVDGNPSNDVAVSASTIAFN